MTFALSRPRPDCTPAGDAVMARGNGHYLTYPVRRRPDRRRVGRGGTRRRTLGARGTVPAPFAARDRALTAAAARLVGCGRPRARRVRLRVPPPRFLAKPAGLRRVDCLDCRAHGEQALAP